MHARVTTVAGDPSKTEAGVAQFRDQALPAVKGMQGYEGAILLVDRQKGAGLAITLWASEDDMRNSEEAVMELRRRAGEAMGADQQEVDRYEVAIFDR